MSLKGAAIAGMVAVFVLPGTAMAEGDVAAGRKKAETCLGCHGIEDYKNAYPTFPVPKLGGQNAQYIVDALKGYANGDRPHNTMHAQAATLSEQDMADLGAYYASLKPTIGEAAADKVELGETIYRAGNGASGVAACAACHASGVAGAPKFGDQGAWGARASKGVDALLSSVINGLNAMPPKGTCATCSDAELKAAIEHMLSQSGL
mgnify:CR=1 FL=1